MGPPRPSLRDNGLTHRWRWPVIRRYRCVGRCGSFLRVVLPRRSHRRPDSRHGERTADRQARHGAAFPPAKGAPKINPTQAVAILFGSRCRSRAARAVIWTWTWIQIWKGWLTRSRSGPRSRRCQRSAEQPRPTAPPGSRPRRQGCRESPGSPRSRRWCRPITALQGDPPEWLSHASPRPVRALSPWLMRPPDRGRS